MADYDLFGNIAVIKGEGKSMREKKTQAMMLLRQPSIKTVVEKIGKVKGRLRTFSVNHIAGEKNTLAEVRENGCRFRFDIEKCYFSPRLAGERKAIAEKIRKKDEVLVMFAGVGVYPIVLWKYAKPKKIVGMELGRACCRAFEENIGLNNVPLGVLEVVQGDVTKKITGRKKYDVVIMARPHLKDTFLKEGLKASKKGTRLIYYGFCHQNEKDRMIEGLVVEARSLRRRLKIVQVVPAGDIAPYHFRYRVECVVTK